MTSVVPVLFGAGSLVGVTVAGRLSGQCPGPAIAVGGPLLLIGWPALVDEPVALPIFVFVPGALWFAPGSALIARVLYEAQRALYNWCAPVRSRSSWMLSARRTRSNFTSPSGLVRTAYTAGSGRLL